MVQDDMGRACLGLFAAWAVHDAEELFTMSRTSAASLASVPGWVPLPAAARERGLSQRHVNLSLGLMGACVGAVALDGARTAGTSALFRGGLLAFGVHGLAHLGASVIRRGYTTGVATAPIVVVPYWLHARGVLRRAGLRDNDAAAVAVAAAGLPLLWGIHAVTGLILGERSLGERSYTGDRKDSANRESPSRILSGA